MPLSKQVVRIVVVSVAAGALGYAAASLMPKQYRSELALYFPQGQSGAGKALGALMLGGQSGDSSSVPNLRGLLNTPIVGSGAGTASGILTSRTALDSVVSDLNLDSKWDLSRSKAIQKLEGLLRVKTDDNGFLQVSATTENPELSKQVLDALYEHLQSRSNSLTLNVGTRNRQILQERLTSAEQMVEDARMRLVRIGNDARLSNAQMVEQNYLEVLRSLNEATAEENAAKTQLARYESDVQKIVKESGRSSAEVLESMSELQPATAQALNALASELHTRQIALEEAKRSFTDSSPEFQSALQAAESAETVGKKVIDSKKQQVAQGISASLLEPRAQLAALSAKRETLQRALSEYDKSLSRAPSAYAAMEEAKQQFGLALQLRSQLETELEIAKIAESRDPARFEVVDKPVADAEPVGPRKSLFAIGLFAIAMLGQGLPWWARRVKWIED